MIPAFVSAQALEIPCRGSDCTFSDLFVLGNRILKLLVILAIPIAAGMFAYAGARMLSAGGNEEVIKDAKKVFYRVFVGFLFVLAAYLIVYTITSVLLDDKYSTLKSGQLDNPSAERGDLVN